MDNTQSHIPEALQSLYRRYAEARHGEAFVTGYGNPAAAVLLIGEAPGRDEIRTGKPFQGSAGRRLDNMLSEAGLSRDALFVTNTVKTRLFKQGIRPGSRVNRPAVRADLLRDLPFLLEEIHLLTPRLIVTLGNVPLKALYLAAGRNDPPVIGDIHGRPVDWLPAGASPGKPIRVFPLYHPASLIYNRALEPIVAEDCRRLGKICRHERFGISNQEENREGYR